MLRMGLTTQGEEKHPFFPTPLLQDLELKVPSCELDSAKGQLEEECVPLS